MGNERWTDDRQAMLEETKKEEKASEVVVEQSQKPLAERGSENEVHTYIHSMCMIH